MQLAEFISLIREGTVSPYMKLTIQVSPMSQQEWERLAESSGHVLEMDPESGTIEIEDVEGFFGWRENKKELNEKIATFLQLLTAIGSPDFEIKEIDLSCTVKFANDQGE